MSFNFDVETLRQILEDEGYDVVTGDTVEGRRETAGRVFEIVADRGGQVRFVRTEEAAEPHAQDVTVEGRNYHLAVNQFKTVTVLTELSRAEDLSGMLQIMEDLSRQT